MDSQEFFDLFKGLERAYGRYDLSSDNSDGQKQGGNARTVQETLTLHEWELHLKGERGLGVIPIKDDNKVHWGAIDIDEYDIDLEVFSKKLGTSPIIPCRTKSGGIHLYVFFEQSMTAKSVVPKLREIATLLNHPTAEIFPKQIQIISERGDVGNWINMPYFGGKLSTRYAIYNGKVLTPEEFIKIAKSKKIKNVNDIKILNLKSNDFELLPDGPPCLQYLLKVGFPEGTRNNALYNLGVYAKKAFPNEWEEKLEDHNLEFMKPPLKSREVQTVISSLNKRSYNYMCSEQPIQPFCNRALCVSQKFGISENGTMPRITGVTKNETEPPTYFLTVDDRRIGPLESIDMLNQKNFQRAVFEHLDRVIPLVSPHLWIEIMNDLMAKVTLVEVTPDSSNKGRLWELCERFCTGSSSSDVMEDLLRGHAVTLNEKTMFRINDFIEFLDKHRFREFKLHEVTAHLKDRGAKHEAKKIKGKHVNIWIIPEFERQKEEFTEPNIEEVFE